MLSRIVNHIEEALIAFLMAAMTILTFVQVVLRYVFNSSIGWALELTTILFGWLILIGISYGMKVGSHLGLDEVVRLLPARWARIAGLLAVGVSLAYAGVLTLGSWDYLETMHMLGVELQDMPVPIWISLLVLPAGFALLGVRLLQIGWGIVTGRQSSIGLGNEAEEALEAHKAAREGTKP